MTFRTNVSNTNILAEKTRTCIVGGIVGSDVRFTYSDTCNKTFLIDLYLFYMKTVESAESPEQGPF